MITLDWLRTGELFLFEMAAVVVMMLYVVLRLLDDLKNLRGGSSDAVQETTK
jgi:hypothetical protein